MTLTKFNKDYPIVADGVRAINSIPPKTDIPYITYRRWVKEGKPVSAVYRVLLMIKGIKI